MSFNLKLLNLFFGMCSGTQGLPPDLHRLGYIPEAVETTFSNSEDRNVAPDLIIASTQIHHTVCFEWKSGANTEADQLQRYSMVVPNDLVAKAFVHVNKCATQDIAIIGKDEHREGIPIGVANGGYAFPVLVTTATGMETILNTFANGPTDAVFRPLNVNWDTLPTSFFPLDADSELWEFAEHAIPHVLEQMVKGAPRIRMDDLAKSMIPHYGRMRPDYKGQLKQKIQQVMDHASRAQFSTYLQRAPRCGWCDADSHMGCDRQSSCRRGRQTAEGVESDAEEAPITTTSRTRSGKRFLRWTRGKRWDNSTSAFRGESDFGNQLLAFQRLRRSKIANCARLSALFAVLARIRFLPRSPTSQSVTRVEIFGVP